MNKLRMNAIWGFGGLVAVLLFGSVAYAQTGSSTTPSPSRTNYLSLSCGDFVLMTPTEQHTTLMWIAGAENYFQDGHVEIETVTKWHESLVGVCGLVPNKNLSSIAKKNPPGSYSCHDYNEMKPAHQRTVLMAYANRGSLLGYGPEMDRSIINQLTDAAGEACELNPELNFYEVLKALPPKMFGEPGRKSR